MFKTTGSERENEAARQYLTQAGYLVLDGEVPVSTGYGSASEEPEAGAAPARADLVPRPSA